MKNTLQKLKVRELLHQYSEIMEELQQRKVIRTNNNPLSDYGEWLICKKLKLTIERSSKKGYDAYDKKNKYQIKCRRLTPEHKSKQLGVIRNLKDKDFDFLIGLIFDSDFNILEAYQVPHSIIKKYAVYSKHQNGHILQLHGDILEDTKVQNILKKINEIY
jgi:hypothetical protein